MSWIGKVANYTIPFAHKLVNKRSARNIVLAKSIIAKANSGEVPNNHPQVEKARRILAEAEKSGRQEKILDFQSTAWAASYVITPAAYVIASPLVFAANIFENRSLSNVVPAAASMASAVATYTYSEPISQVTAQAVDALGGPTAAAAAAAVVFASLAIRDIATGNIKTLI